MPHKQGFECSKCGADNCGSSNDLCVRCSEKEDNIGSCTHRPPRQKGDVCPRQSELTKLKAEQEQLHQKFDSADLGRAECLRQHKIQYERAQSLEVENTKLKERVKELESEVQKWKDETTDAASALLDVMDAIGMDAQIKGASRYAIRGTAASEAVRELQIENAKLQERITELEAVVVSRGEKLIANSQLHAEETNTDYDLLTAEIANLGERICKTIKAIEGIEKDYPATAKMLVAMLLGKDSATEGA